MSTHLSPEEEANKLFNEIFIYLQEYGEEYGEEILVRTLSKQLAIMNVENIINSRSEDARFDDRDWQLVSSYANETPLYLTYWLNVKKHLSEM